MVRNAATVALETSAPNERIDAAGDQDVVDQGDQHRHRVLGLEPDRHVGRDHQQAEDDRDHRRAGDLLAEGGPDRGRVEAVVALLEPERVLEQRADLRGLLRRDLAPGSGRRSRRSRGSRSPGSWPRRRHRCRRRRAPRGSPRPIAGSASAAWIRVPDSKSMPRLSRLVAKAIAPIARITPETEKNHFEAPVKSKFHLRPSPLAPRKLGERRTRERPRTPSTAWVKRTAVNSETIVPMPSVNAKPFTPALAEHEQDEGRDQGDHVRVDDRRDALAVALGDRREHRAARPDLLLYSLEDDDVGVGGDADRQDQARDSRQRQRDRDQLDQGEEEDRVDEQPEPGDDAQEAVVGDQEQQDEREPGEPRLQPLVERLLAERRRDRGSG